MQSNITINRAAENRTYTNMSNYHLQDRRLSLKARGLLSTILSLPATWHLSVEGLVKMVADGATSVRSALDELSRLGYIVVEQGRSGGQFCGCQYTVNEHPSSMTAAPRCVRPARTAPYTENPHTGNRKQSNTQEEIKHPSTDSLSNPIVPATNQAGGGERRKASYEKRSEPEVKHDFSELAQNSPEDGELLDALSKLVSEVASAPEAKYSVNGRQLTGKQVAARFAKLKKKHLQSVAAAIKHNKNPIRNLRAYLIAALYNAAAVKLVEIVPQKNDQERQRQELAAAVRRNYEWMSRVNAQSESICAV